MEHKTLILLVGPTASGKSSIAACMSKRFNLTIAKSYTTRKPRFPGEDGYHFVTPEQFNNLNLCERTEYAGNFYGSTQEELVRSDIFICDGNGVKSIKKHYKGSKLIYVVRLYADERTLADRLKQRGMTESEISARRASDMRSINHLVSDFSIAADGSENEIPLIASTIMEFVNYHEKHSIGQWLITDPDCAQHVKMIDRNTFQCIQFVQFPNDLVRIAEATINLLDYSAEELLNEVHPFGYTNTVQIYKYPDTTTREIVAECVFENHALENLRSETFWSLTDAEEWIADHIKKGE